MTPNRMKFVWLGGSVIIAMGLADGALAHVQSGALGANANATDIFTVDCPVGDGSVRLETQINDVTPVKPPRLQVTVQKGSLVATAVDPVDGDGQYSPLATVNGGLGAYTVSLSKLPRAGGPDASRGHPESYVLRYHCLRGNVHTETNISYIQNQ